MNQANGNVPYDAPRPNLGPSARPHAKETTDRATISGHIETEGATPALFEVDKAAHKRHSSLDTRCRHLADDNACVSSGMTYRFNAAHDCHLLTSSQTERQEHGTYLTDDDPRVRPSSSASTSDDLFLRRVWRASIRDDAMLVTGVSPSTEGRHNRTRPLVDVQTDGSEGASAYTVMHLH